jgi:hypothetical protein
MPYMPEYLDDNLNTEGDTMNEPDYEKALDSILRRPAGRPKKRPIKRAGRPVMPDSEKHKSLSVSLSPEAIAALEKERRRRSTSSVRNTCSTSQVVEDLIRQVLMGEDRASIAGQLSQLSDDLKEFYEIARLAKAVWGRSQSGLPGEVDGVMERLTKKFNALQRRQGIEPTPMPWEVDDEPPLPEPEEADEGGYVL